VDTSTSCRASFSDGGPGAWAFELLYRGPFQRGLDAEYRIITGLAAMSDEELDRVCETFSRINLAPFFFGEWLPMLTETVRWLVIALPPILRDWRLGEAGNERIKRTILP
jgi:hypothetical protein